MKKVISSFSGKYAFLNNFYEHDLICKVAGKIVKYKTIEHAFQSAKAKTVAARSAVIAAASAAEAKSLGNAITLREDWDDVKYGVMKTFVLLKFMQNPDLAKKLIATKDAKLVEGNTWDDCIWGVCEGKGTNWLGIILMQVRDVCCTIHNPDICFKK